MEDQKDCGTCSPYCKVCGACGEEGCCSPIMCEFSPDGDYCETYLRDLKFSHLMYRDTLSIINDNGFNMNLLDDIFDENYKVIYEKPEKKDD